MVLAMRFARFGVRGRPFYRIVVADAKSPRDGKHIERVGTFDPIPVEGKQEGLGKKLVTLDIERIKHWLSVGAQPSDSVARLLGKAGILPPNPVRKSAIKLQEKEV